MKHVKLVFAMLLLAAVLVFVFSNTAPVVIHFLVWQTPPVSLSAVAALFFVVGCLFTLLIGLLLKFRRRTGREQTESKKEENSRDESPVFKETAAPPEAPAAENDLKP
jgi:uncharacterized integral membrane protein